jgi:hypothetical protein
MPRPLGLDPQIVFCEDESLVAERVWYPSFAENGAAQPPEKTFHLSASLTGVVICGLGKGAVRGALINAVLTLSLPSEFKEPLDRFVPIGAILEFASVGLLALRGEDSGLEAVVLVFVCVLSEEKRLNVALRGEGDSAGLESPLDRCSRIRLSCSRCSLVT